MTFELLPQEERKINRQRDDLLDDYKTSLKNSPALSLALIEMPMINIVVQDGPYCTRMCKHCSGDFGPLKPKAPMKLYEELTRQIPSTAISHIIITDGEPMHDISRIEDIIRLFDGLPIEINTNGEFAKTLQDAESVLDRLRSAGMTFQKQPSRSVDITTNSALALSADRYHGEESYTYAFNTFLAFNNVFKELSVKDILGKDHDTRYHLAVTGVYGPDSSARKTYRELNKKLIKPLQAAIPRNSYSNLEMGGKYFVTKHFAALIHASSMIDEGRAIDMFPKRGEKKDFTPDQASRILPTSPGMYLTSNGNLYNVVSNQCTVPGRLAGNIFNEPLAEIISRTMQEPVYQIERERGIKGLYTWLYQNGVKIQARDHCDLCRDIFEDREGVDTLNKLLSDSWVKYVDKLRNSI